MSKEQRFKSRNALLSFKQGNFNEAKRLFTEVLFEAPNNSRAMLYNGYIALLENKPAEAVERLQAACGRMPGSKAAKSLLADAYYRQDDFAGAAALYRSLGKKPFADKLLCLASRTPYAVSRDFGRAEVRFEKKDPLPLVQVSVNGMDPVNFLIDTGGAEVIVDTEYAKTLGLADYGTEKSFFGGGKTGAFGHTCLDALRLGALQVENLPAVTMDTRKFSTPLYGDACRVDGILGTCLLSHFLTTLDYAHEKIVFERPGSILDPAAFGSVPDEGFTPIPYWMAGDHFMVARGSANDSAEALYFIDTGLAGMAFTCPKSTVRECGLRPLKGNAASGEGAGGRFRLIPFDLGSLCLGGIKEHNLHGVFGAFPSQLERLFGFRIGGLISHEFFRNRTVAFDFQRTRLFIK